MIRDPWFHSEKGNFSIHKRCGYRMDNPEPKGLMEACPTGDRADCPIIVQCSFNEIKLIWRYPRPYSARWLMRALLRIFHKKKIDAPQYGTRNFSDYHIWWSKRSSRVNLCFPMDDPSSPWGFWNFSLGDFLDGHIKTRNDREHTHWTSSDWRFRFCLRFLRSCWI